MAVILHPDIEATFQDFVADRDLSEKPPEELWRVFLDSYHVETWEILYEDFLEFLTQIFKKERCVECGDGTPPYFFKGDSICIRCSVTNINT